MATSTASTLIVNATGRKLGSCAPCSACSCNSWASLASIRGRAPAREVCCIRLAGQSAVYLNGDPAFCFGVWFGTGSRGHRQFGGEDIHRRPALLPERTQAERVVALGEAP